MMRLVSVNAPIHKRPETGAQVALMAALPYAVWLVDAATHELLAVNPAAEQLLGMGPADLLGRTIDSLVSTPEDAMFWLEAGAVADKRNALLESDTMMRHAEGHMLWVTRRIAFVADADSEGFWVLSFRDQTAQRRQDDEREALLSELRATLESTADAILVTDLAGRMRSFNKRFAALWDLPEDLLTDKNDEAVQIWMRRSVADGAAYAARLSAIQEAPLLQSSDQLVLLNGRVIERVSLPQFSRGR
jgi:PAS domain S-box-containing protein